MGLLLTVEIDSIIMAIIIAVLAGGAAAAALLLSAARSQGFQDQQPSAAPAQPISEDHEHLPCYMVSDFEFYSIGRNYKIHRCGACRKISGKRSLEVLHLCSCAEFHSTFAVHKNEMHKVDCEFIEYHGDIRSLCKCCK